jgi:hypothetical protein
MTKLYDQEQSNESEKNELYNQERVDDQSTLDTDLLKRSIERSLDKVDSNAGVSFNKNWWDAGAKTVSYHAQLFKNDLAQLFEIEAADSKESLGDPEWDGDIFDVSLEDWDDKSLSGTYVYRLPRSAFNGIPENILEEFLIDPEGEYVISRSFSGSSLDGPFSLSLRGAGPNAGPEIGFTELEDFWQAVRIVSVESSTAGVLLAWKSFLAVVLIILMLVIVAAVAID